MYEAVHAVPDGASTLARFARTAEAYGLDGLVVRNHGDADGTDDLDRVRDAVGIDVVDGVEIKADDPSRLSGFLGSYRPERTVVLVHGGTDRVNRFAVGQRRVDVLAHPGSAEATVDHVLAREAAENGVRLEVNLAGVLREAGGERVRTIDRLRRLARLIDDAGAPYVVSADPTDHLQLRAPRELVAVGSELGFDPGWVETGLAEWGRIAERNRERLDEGTVGPGVRRRPGPGGDGP